jgi:hypothetical protein
LMREGDGLICELGLECSTSTLVDRGVLQRQTKRCRQQDL